MDNIKDKKKTPFEEQVEAVKLGNKTLPKVSVGAMRIPYFKYQIATHHYQLKLMSKGLHFKDFKLKDLKDYYGLKGRSTKECLVEFEEIKDKYLKNE